MYGDGFTDQDTVGASNLTARPVRPPGVPVQQVVARVQRVVKEAQRFQERNLSYQPMETQRNSGILLASPDRLRGGARLERFDLRLGVALSPRPIAREI
jgi:hypothetical protein